MSSPQMPSAPTLADLTQKANAIGRYPSEPPLNNAIAFMDDQAEIETFIRDFHALDPSSINQKDSYGMAPIYVAASRSKLSAVRVLLELDIDLANLRTRDTGDRVTPLMTIQDNLRTTRNFLSGETIYFGGNPCKASLEDEMEIERMIKRAIGDYGIGSGCSCHLCDGGWLSERTRARLHVTAERILAGMLKKMQKSTYHEGPDDPYLAYLPLGVRNKMSTRLYNGYRSYMVIISNILAGRDGRGKVPDFDTICLLLPPQPNYAAHTIFNTPLVMTDAWFYREKNGHIDNVLECLIEMAAREINETDTVWLKRTAKMRSCNNDDNFDLVRRKLGMWGDLS